MCAPAVLVVQPSVSWVAVPANLAVAPAVAPATVLGLAAMLLAPGWPWAAGMLTGVAGAACWWIATVARYAAELPSASVPWLAGPAGVALLVVATIAGTRLLLQRARPDHAGAGTPGGACPSGMAGWSGASRNPSTGDPLTRGRDSRTGLDGGGTGPRGARQRRGRPAGRARGRPHRRPQP
ncbi:ComEC/Rec2 family competence protein [Cellulomonas soli]